MFKFIGFIATLGLASLSHAETTDSTGTTTATTSVSQTEVHGSLELRPSLTLSSGGTLRTENTAEANVTLQPNLKLGYTQYFETNLNNPSAPSWKLDPIATDGFANIRLNEILTAPEFGLKFNYEGRVYMPTAAVRRDHGFITEVRNYFKLEKKVNDTLTLTAMEAPIIFAHNRSGFTDSKGTKANPNFENRFYIIADINIIDKLTLSIPLMFHNTHLGQHAGAIVGQTSETWNHFLWTYPEITYEFSPVVTAGLAYYSNNLVKPDLSGFTLGDGLENGVLQTIVKFSL